MSTTALATLEAAGAPDVLVATPASWRGLAIGPDAKRLRRNAARRLLDVHPDLLAWMRRRAPEGRLIELFFSIMQRRLLRGGEFASVDDFTRRIIAFINDYNRKAKPFKWTYAGRPLKVA